MHLAVYANLRPETLNCSLVLCLFESLISYSQKYLECRMRLIVLLRCQRNLTYSKLSLAPPGCQDVLGRRDFGHEGEALSLNHHLGETASHLQNRICFISIIISISSLFFFLQEAYLWSVFWQGQTIQSHVVFTIFPWSYIWTIWGKTGSRFTFHCDCI